MKEDIRENIKGHFHTGVFYGLCFGGPIGLCLITYPILAMIYAVLILLLKNGLEENSYFHCKSLQTFVTQSKKRGKTHE